MTLGLMLLMMGQEPAVAGGPDIRERIACAPMSASAPPAAGMKVSGSAYPGRTMFGPGDAVVVNAGTEQGVQKGQMFYVRRQVRDEFTPATAEFTPISIHTAGWVTIIDAKEYVSVATVTHACDGVLYGDYLEPFTPPAAPPPTLAGTPDFANPAHMVMADERRQSVTEGQMMIIDRGSEGDVRAGQTVTLYRQTMSGVGPTIDIGRATVLSVSAKTSLVRVDWARDAVSIGDLAAIHK